ncbi:MAG: hypothetical protein HFJ54_00485 [Clostridia bacterium]|nr:hypothetical protein [Clostridia bacterium]
MVKNSSTEILEAIARVNKAVSGLKIEMNKRFEENDKHHEEMMNEMNRRFEEMTSEMNKRFEENDKHHEEMMSEMNKRFDKNDEDHRYLSLAIDTLGILSKENDIDHVEYNKRLNINRVKFSSQ